MVEIAKPAVAESSAEISQLDTWLFSLLATLLVIAPIFRGGNRPLALIVIQIIALGLAALLLWNPSRLRSLPLAIRLISILSLLYIGISLLQIPTSLWLTISGHKLYADALQLVIGSTDPWRAISILPIQTEAAWFRVLTVISVFITVYCLPLDQVQRLVYIVLGIAGCEAVLGLMQWGAGPSSILRFSSVYHARDAIGTYANRDHLAGFLAMVNPVVLGLLAVELGQNSLARKRNPKFRRRDFWASVKGQRAVLMALLSVLLLLAIVFTRSRAGIALSMVGLFVAGLAFAWRLGGRGTYGIIGTVLAGFVILAAEIGLMPVLDRFSEDPMQDKRWTMYATTIDGIGYFFPLGSGAGTFPGVYPAFQPVKLGNYFINHAHNDFLEAVFEQGVFGAALIFLALIIYAARWKTVRTRKDEWVAFSFIQIGSGIGVLMLLLHSLGDFNLQIPANAIFFAFFAGVFFKDYQELESRTRRRHRHRRQHKESEETSAETAATTENTEPGKPKHQISWQDFGDITNPLASSDPSKNNPS